MEPTHALRHHGAAVTAQSPMADDAQMLTTFVGFMVEFDLDPTAGQVFRLDRIAGLRKPQVR